MTIYSIGIDVSKDDFSVCLMAYKVSSQERQVVARKSFGNRSGGYKAFLSWAGRFVGQTDHPVRMTMEATGVYYESLALYISEQDRNIHLSVVLPSKAKRYLQSLGLRSKTDKIDAFGLASMGAERRLKRWEGIDPFWRELRQITRARTNLQDQRTQLRNKCHALTHSGMAGQEVLDALEKIIEELNEQIARLKDTIEEILHSRDDLGEDLKRAESIQGIGLQTIAKILAETNGFDRFTSISQLISFSGYDVVFSESGSQKGKTHISKKGSPHIRHAMYMPANVIIRQKKGPIYELYKRLVNKHGISMKAHVAIQKKLLTYVYTIWKKKEYFNPEKITQQRTEQANKVALPNDKATVDTSHAVAL